MSRPTALAWYLVSWRGRATIAMPAWPHRYETAGSDPRRWAIDSARRSWGKAAAKGERDEYRLVGIVAERIA